MEIIALAPTGFASNCFIIHNGKDAFAIDASLPPDRVLGTLREQGLTLRGILLTHGHFDHIFYADELRKATGAPVYIHSLDAEMLHDSEKNAYSVFTGGSLPAFDADILLQGGDTVKLGNEDIKVIHTPGHTRGSVCFDTKDFMLTGDTLFAFGFGRCDLYGGNAEAIKSSLSRLQKLADEDNKYIYCGHGESSTLKMATDRIRYYF